MNSDQAVGLAKTDEDPLRDVLLIFCENDSRPLFHRILAYKHSVSVNDAHPSPTGLFINVPSDQASPKMETLGLLGQLLSNACPLLPFGPVQSFQIWSGIG